MLSRFSIDDQKTNNTSQYRQFVVFRLLDKYYGVNIHQTREIIAEDDYELTPVPSAPDFVRGIINLRGEIVPIISLKNKLILSAKEQEKNDYKIITVEINNSLIGMEVDDVKEIIRFDVEDISNPPNITQNIDNNYVDGVGKTEEGLLIILNLNTVLSKKEIEKIDQIDI